MESNQLHVLVPKLQLTDGQPDVLARRSMLDDLVDHGLSKSELRHLRARLTALSMNNDICVNLPNELLLCVAQFLNLDDLLRARSVSRAWNERFCSPDLCVHFIKLHFRSTWEKSYRSLESEAQELAKVTLSKWFPRAAVKRLRRQHGNYRSLTVFRYAKLHNRWFEFGDHTRDALYNSGRIAFRTDSRTIAVQSLTGDALPKMLMDADRAPIGDWLLSDQFVIAQKANPKLSLIAWDFELNPVDNVRLPSSIRHMSAYRNQVGLITKSNEALVWHIGGPLKLLDTSEIHEKLVGYSQWDAAAVLFHPIDEATTFVVHHAVTDPDVDEYTLTYTIRLIVQEFFKEQQRCIYCVDTIYKVDSIDRLEYYGYGSDISTNIFVHRDLMDTLHAPPSDVRFDIRFVVNADGLCGIWRRMQKPLSGEIKLRQTNISFVTFDMYSKQFDTVCRQPDLPRGLSRTVHGQAVDMFQERLRVAADARFHEEDLSRTTYGDDDFVVVFGNSEYAVAVT